MFAPRRKGSLGRPRGVPIQVGRVGPFDTTITVSPGWPAGGSAG